MTKIYHCLPKPSSFFEGKALDDMKRYAAVLREAQPAIADADAMEIMCGSFVAVSAANSDEELDTMIRNAVTRFVPEIENDPDLDALNVQQIMISAVKILGELKPAVN